MAIHRFIAPSKWVRYSDAQTMTYGTLPSRFLNAVDTHPNPRAQMVRRDGRWEAIASQEFLRRVAGLSTAFVELGVKPGDRVGLFSANRPEWHTADFAIHGAGAVTVPVYFNESSDRMTYILKHCAAKVVFVVGAAQLRKLLNVRQELPELEQIILADGGAEVPGECLCYETLIAGASAPDISSYRQRSSQVLPGQLASIIYTSGTTGEPKGVMLTHANFCSNVTDVGLALQAQWKLADKLVYKKIRLGTGGQLRIVSSGGAPLSKSLAEFFWTVGIPIYQGYGLTETSPIVSSNYPVNRMGSSGKPIANVLVRAAEDGEILVKGPCVMHGYYKNAEATREVLSEDGWFRTGDIGYVDKDNYIFITDRKKDLLKTAAGKFVAPQPIENALKTSPYILNAMVVGDRRKFIVALIVPNPTTVAAKAADQGIKFASNAELAAHPWVHSLIDAEVKRLTVHLAQYETIKRFALLPEDFTFDNGSLTFTLKLKRRVVEQQYAAVIESLYADVAEPRPILQD